MTTTSTARSEPNLSHLHGALLVLATSVFFSFGGLAFRSTDGIDAWQYLVYRGIGMLLATAIVLALTKRHQVREVIAQAQASHVAAGVILGGLNCIFIVSLELATVAFILFFQTMAPLAAAYFSWVFLRERVAREVVVATTVSLVGVTIMVSATLTDAIRPAALIVLFIPVGFGLYATLIRSADRIDPSIPILAGGVTVLAVASIVVVAGSGFDASARDAMIGVFAGSVLLGFPLAVFNTAQRVVPSPETSLLMLGEVVLAPIWVWWFVDEQPEPTTLVGGTIILASVAWLTAVRSPRRGRPVTSRG